MERAGDSHLLPRRERSPPLQVGRGHGTPETLLQILPTSFGGKGDWSGGIGTRGWYLDEDRKRHRWLFGDHLGTSAEDRG